MFRDIYLPGKPVSPEGHRIIELLQFIPKRNHTLNRPLFRRLR